LLRLLRANDIQAHWTLEAFHSECDPHQLIGWVGRISLDRPSRLQVQVGIDERLQAPAFKQEHVGGEMANRPSTANDPTPQIPESEGIDDGIERTSCSIIHITESGVVVLAQYLAGDVVDAAVRPFSFAPRQTLHLHVWSVQALRHDMLS